MSVPRDILDNQDEHSNLSGDGAIADRHQDAVVLPQEMPDLSNKDADVQLKTMKDRRTFMFHRLRTQMAVVNDLFELTNIDRMNQEMSAVDQMLNSLIEMNIQCTTLFTPEQVEEAICWMSTIDNEVFELKSRVL